MKIKENWKKIMAWTLGVLAVVCLAVQTMFIIESDMEKRRIAQYPFEIMKHEAELAYNENKSKLVREVNHYIDSVAPSSNLTGYAVVDMAEKYDLDIKFVLAQGQIESHFGTTGMALKTNSVFNVGAYDNLKFENINGKFKYKHPDFSIEPYMQLLYKNYITGSKTELDLMAKYVTSGGKRYSSNVNYEREILELYKSIDSHTDISALQGEVRRFKIICGK